ncbi:MAG: amidohydrolase family protein, partial [Acidimicrobiales bacterium]
ARPTRPTPLRPGAGQDGGMSPGLPDATDRTATEPSERIDAHQHFWAMGRGDYHWMPETGRLRRDYLPPELAELNRAAGISGTITVQAAQTEQETDWLLALAEHPGSMVLGVVGWAPLGTPAAGPALDRLAAHPLAVGVRPMLHDLADPAWITRPEVVEDLARVGQAGLTFDVLSYPGHLPHVISALEAVPDLDVVVDHLSKPAYRGGPDPDWKAWMAVLAARPRTAVKLSGMVTEVGPGWQPADFRSHADHALEAFGPDRVMWGSDWPVCLEAAEHAEVVGLAEDLLAGLAADEQEAVWAGTARAFYGV